ncbi:protein-disulfide reductase DsbD domain-containing protein, partial [Singulisphaera rosea]
STSRYWIVPHFEKMLYDNAQLASAHLLAFEATGDARWRREAEDTFAFIARTMTAPEGGFYSALDAETQGEEGRYYVWSQEAVTKALGAGPDVEAFTLVYGMKREPNFEKDRYVLLEPRSRAEQALTLKTTPDVVESRIAPLRAKLLSVREQRPAPLRDDKVLTSWNGLMIAAYADGFRILKEPRYRLAAERAADFLLSKMRTPDGRLLRSFRSGRAKLPAYLEDYAFLAQGLLRLHAATGDPRRLEQARELTDRMIADFLDTKDGGFFYTATDHESLVARPKEAIDGVLPSGNSVAIRNLVALAKATGKSSYLDLAGKTLETFSARLNTTPASHPLMLVGLGEYLDARPNAARAVTSPPVEDPSGGTVTVRGELVAPVASGRDVDVVVKLQVKEGWHVYANPVGVENLIPTSVELAPDQPLTVTKVEYPTGEAKVLASSGDEKVSVYEGQARIKVHLRLKDDARTMPETVDLRVRYQTCNDRSCLAPATVSVPITLEKR